MSIEEANKIVTLSLEYSTNGWEFVIETHQPYGAILGYKKHATPNEAYEELKQFLRYFTENVLKTSDTIRAYIEKHKPNKEEVV